MKAQLLVEGTDDQHIVWALCQKYEVEKTFSVKSLEGIDELFKGIPQRIRSGQFNTLGIVIDADTDLTARWEKTKATFTRFSYILPDTPDKNGTIVELSDKTLPYPLKIGIWLMPNNQMGGIVEDFMQQLIQEDNSLFSEAQAATQKVETEIAEDLRFAAKDRSKALIHNYLSWQQSPGTPMGLAITKKYFDADAALAQQFVNWLNRLFN